MYTHVFVYMYICHQPKDEEARFVSIHHHTSAHVRRCQHTSAYVSTRQHIPKTNALSTVTTVEDTHVVV